MSNFWGAFQNFNFQFSLYRNNEFEVMTENSINKYIFIGIYDDTTNRIEVRNVSYIEKDRIAITIGKKITNITKYNVSITGKRKKVEKEELKLII